MVLHPCLLLVFYLCFVARVCVSGISAVFVFLFRFFFVVFFFVVAFSLLLWFYCVF